MRSPEYGSFAGVRRASHGDAHREGRLSRSFGLPGIQLGTASREVRDSMLIRCMTILFMGAPLPWPGLASLPAAEPWPDLPKQNDRVELPAQQWPLRPGPRTIETVVHYPGAQA